MQEIRGWGGSIACYLTPATRYGWCWCCYPWFRVMARRCSTRRRRVTYLPCDFLIFWLFSLVKIASLGVRKSKSVAEIVTDQLCLWEVSQSNIWMCNGNVALKTGFFTTDQRQFHDASTPIYLIDGKRGQISVLLLVIDQRVPERAWNIRGNVLAHTVE